MYINCGKLQRSYNLVSGKSCRVQIAWLLSSDTLPALTILLPHTVQAPIQPRPILVNWSVYNQMAPLKV